MTVTYSVEYAKSGRSSCKGCKTTINQGELRLVKEVDQEDGHHSMKSCFHLHCLKKPSSLPAVEGTSSLSTEDRSLVQQWLEGSLKGSLSAILAPAPLDDGALEALLAHFNAAAPSKKRKSRDDENDSDDEDNTGSKKKEEINISAGQQLLLSKALQKAVTNSAFADLKKAKVGDIRAAAEEKGLSGKGSKELVLNRLAIFYARELNKSAENVTQVLTGEASLEKQKLEAAIVEAKKLNVETLKEIMRKNNGKVTGTKDELISRFAQFKTYGQAPACPKCSADDEDGGGKAKMSILNLAEFGKPKIYKCSGYFSEAQNRHKNCTWRGTVEDETKPFVDVSSLENAGIGLNGLPLDLKAGF